MQYDKASPRKFFRCGFALYQDNADLILGNVEGDYVLDYQSIAGETSAVVKKEDAALSENVKKLADGLIDKYKTFFYDEDMDTFACRVVGTESEDLISLWSPYLQKFVHDHKILEKYSDNFMTEIYVEDINQGTNRDVFSDLGYFNSIFRKMETRELATFDNSFMARSTVYDLKSTRNLPFFHGTQVYNNLQVHVNSSFYPGAFHLLFQEYNETFSSISDDYKFAEGSTIDTSGFADGQVFYEVDEDGNPISIYRMSGSTPVDIGFSSTADIEGETLYNIVKNYLLDSYVTGASISGTISSITGPVSGVYTYTLTVTGSPQVTTDLLLEKVSGNGSLGTGAYVSAVNGSVLTVKSSSLPTAGTIVFKFINRLNVTESLLTEINSLFLTTNIKNYVFIPLVLYVLMENISSSAS